MRINLNQRFPRKYILLAVLFLGFVLHVKAQNNPYSILSSKIDSLADIGLPKSALVQVDQLDSLARQNKNPVQQIRAVIYRMTLQSYIEESAISPIINRLRADIDRSEYPVKSVLQSLLAEMYWKYYQQNRYQFSQRTALEKPDPDLSRWDLKTIIAETSSLYQLSLSESAKAQQSPISILDGVLAGDSSTRYLRPSLYDFLVHRALAFYFGELVGTQAKSGFYFNDARYFGNSQTFGALVFNSGDTVSITFNGVRLLQQATRFHIKTGNAVALADIDLKRLEFFFRESTMPGKDAAYLQALNQMVRAVPSVPLTAEALVLLGKYYQQRDSLKIAIGYFDEALKTYPLSIGGKNADILLKEIRRQMLYVQFEDTNLPHKPILALLNYRNLQKVKTSIYKLSLKQAQAYREIPKGLHQPHRPVLDFLANLSPVKTDSLVLPGSADYKSHSAEFAIGALPSGSYVLLVESSEDLDSSCISAGDFYVSQLAYVKRSNANGRKEIRIVDRETGAPVKGVGIAIQQHVQDKQSPRLFIEGFTDASGKFMYMWNDAYPANILLTTKKDTLFDNQVVLYGGKLTEAGDADYRTVFFTDRQIYRPGQTIYFKGLYLKVLNNVSSIVSDAEMDVQLLNVNVQKITSMKVKTNEFGTFSGSFVLPPAMLNGNVTISTDEGRIRVKVEAYKRPSFRVQFMPIKETYRLGDSIHVHGQILAFSGYGLSGATVSYRVVRNQTWFDYNLYDSRNQSPVDIVSDTIPASPSGEFEIKFKAADNHPLISDLRYMYSLQVDVTDSIGETQSGNSLIAIRRNPLNVLADLPQIVFKNDSLKVPVRITNMAGYLQAGSVNVKVYGLKEPRKQLRNRLWNLPDQYVMNKEEFNKQFPYYAWQKENVPAYWPVDSYAGEIVLKSDTSTVFSLDFSSLKLSKSGTYRFEFYARSAGGDTVSLNSYTCLMTESEKTQGMKNWVLSKKGNQVKSGMGADFIIGTGASDYILMEVYNGPELVFEEWLKTNGKILRKPFVLNVREQDDYSVQFLMAANNRLFSMREKIPHPAKDKLLDIKLSSFRNILQPGEKEVWNLQITGNDGEAKMTELLAGMYDASLDAIAPKIDWIWILNPEYKYTQDYNSWLTYDFVSQAQTQPVFYENYYNPLLKRDYESFFLFGYNYYGGSNYSYREYIRKLEQKRKATALKSDTMVVESRDLPASLSMIRIGGTSTINAKDLEELRPSVIDQTLQGRLPVLQYIDDYGNQLSQSEQASSRLSADNSVIRKNFNETAFFYPQLRTNPKGEISINFTMPDALTRWKFRAIAHTQEPKFGYIEKELVTQKILMVSANMPRFFREGDTLVVSARVANLDKNIVKAKVELQLFNGLSMQPVDLFTEAMQANQTITLQAGTNQSVSFKIFIPQGLDAIAYRITADAGVFRDGEENTIPVLPNSMLVTESMPMMVRSGQTKSFTFQKLLGQQSSTLRNKTLTLEFTQNPTWYALQALPYLMEFPHECTEQTFSRYYANSMATFIVNQRPIIRRLFDQWKNANSATMLSNLEKNQELKALLLEETPWLRDAENETEQKKRIGLLFDINTMSNELQANATRLSAMQMPDGAFPWFAGSRYADRYITQHILAGIGQLKQLGIGTDAWSMNSVASKALNYLDNVILKDSTSALTPIVIHYWYTRSYFRDIAVGEKLQPVLADYLKKVESQWKLCSVYEQGMIALTMLRYNKPEFARMIVRSLSETAQRSDELGMYWGRNQLGYYWYQSPIEAQSMLIELFTEAGNQEANIEEMKIWLLRNKQSTNWKTTKATAAACFALLLRGQDGLVAEAESEIRIAGMRLANLKPDVKPDAGTGYIKTSWSNEQISPALGNVELKNTGKTVNWGALHWQYTENLDKITLAETNLKLERKYFISKETANGIVLTGVDASHIPKVGDLLKVVIYLKADRDFEYVHVKDMRPAGTEPGNVLSGYKYQDKLFYYQMIKDASASFFISNLPKGNYVFEYNLRVAQTGIFSTGISTIQCMYAPEFNAHSEGQRIVFK